MNLASGRDGSCWSSRRSKKSFINSPLPPPTPALSQQWPHCLAICCALGNGKVLYGRVVGSHMGTPRSQACHSECMCVSEQACKHFDFLQSLYLPHPPFLSRLKANTFLPPSWITSSLLQLPQEIFSPLNVFFSSILGREFGAHPVVIMI